MRHTYIQNTAFSPARSCSPSTARAIDLLLLPITGLPSLDRGAQHCPHVLLYGLCHRVQVSPNKGVPRRM